MSYTVLNSNKLQLNELQKKVMKLQIVYQIQYLKYIITVNLFNKNNKQCSLNLLTQCLKHR